MSGTDNLSSSQIKLTPEIVLRAYAAGIFPMAESAENPELFWVDPEFRGILPFEHFHVPRSLRKTVRQNKFEIRYNTNFDGVIKGCGEHSDDRRETWINGEIIYLYSKLFKMGHAHTVECWQDGGLVGGLYGVSMRGAFFGESMFSRVRDASKVALVHLMARLRYGGFTLLDTQFVTEHLSLFGALEVPRERYHELLDDAMAIDATYFSSLEPELEASLLSELMQSSTQTS